MFDLVTVTFDQELPMMTLQARSLAAHADRNDVGRIVLITNGEDEAEERRQLETHVVPLYGDLADRVQFFGRSELLTSPFDGERSGWRTQQLCKMLIAGRLEAEHYLILDSKNVFVRPLRRAELFAKGRPKLSVHSYGPSKIANYNTARAVLEQPPVPDDTRIGQIATPYMIDRRVMLDMIGAFERRLGEPLDIAFSHAEANLTEFLMYYAYLKLLDETGTRAYAKGKYNIVPFWTFRSRDVVDRAVAKLLQQDTKLALSLHRNFVRTAPPDVMDRIATILADVGVVEESSVARDVFHRMVTRTPLGG